MRRLWTALAIAGIAAVTAVPALAASHDHPATTKSAATISAKAPTRKATDKAKARHTAMATQELLRSAVAPAVPADPTIAGVKPGALPWKLASGDVVLETSRFQVDLSGFVIPGKGVGPVKTVNASLYCDGSTKPAATTKPVTLSSSGDAKIDETTALPKTCIAPLVLVHPNGQADSYVAASGWKR